MDFSLIRYLRRVLKGSTDASHTQVMSRFTNPHYRYVIREDSCTRVLGKTIKSLELVKGAGLENSSRSGSCVGSWKCPRTPPRPL